MTQSEFLTWLEGHMAVFGLVREHFDKLENAQQETMVAAWFGILRNTEQSDALAATNQMLADPKLQPSSGAKEDRVPHHVTKIRGMAEDLKERRLYGQWTDGDGEQRLACLRCMDSGWVSIWATDRGDKGETGVTTCPYCERGRALFKQRAPRHQRNEPQRHRAWVEGVIVPGKTQREQRSAMVRAKCGPPGKLYAERMERLKRVIAKRDAEKPRDSDKGFQHVSQEIPF